MDIIDRGEGQAILLLKVELSILIRHQKLKNGIQRSAAASSKEKRY